MVSILNMDLLFLASLLLHVEEQSEKNIILKIPKKTVYKMCVGTSEL